MMKKSLFGALLLFVLAACSPRMETVVILSTNDIHAHIEKFPQLAEAVKKCRDTVKNVILVDAGDRWTGNVYCDRAAEPRRPIIDLMNRQRYDVATFGNHEQSHMGQNYLKCLFALGFQGFLILICVAIYAVLIQSVAISGDAINSIWSIVGYTVLLCFSLFKTSSVTKSVLGAH